MSDITINSNSRIARNTIFLSIRMFVVLCINLYTTRVVLENLGVQDYGIYNVVCGFVSMFMFINTSLTNGIQRFYNYELGKSGETNIGQIFTTSILIQLIVVVILLALTETIGLWYLNNKMVIPHDRFLASKYIYQLAIASFVIVILQSPFSAAVMAYEKMDYYAVVSIATTVLKLAVALVLPYLGYDRLVVYGLLLFTVSVIEFLSYYVFTRVKFKALRLTKLKDLSQFKSMFAFSGWNLFGSFAGVMKEQGINLILNLFFGPVVNAARGIAVQVNGGLQSFVSNLTIPVRPQVIKSYAAGDVQRTMSLTYTISKLSCFFLYMLALPIISEIDFILRLWLGSDVPEYTSSFIVIIIITSFFNNLNAAVSGVVHASGKMMQYQLSTSFIALLSLPSAYVVLKFSGNPNSALLMVLISMFFVQIVSLFILKRIVQFSILDYFKKVILPLILVVAFTFYIPILVCEFMNIGWLRFCINVFSSASIVAIVVYMCGLSKTEKLILKQLVKR